MSFTFFKNTLSSPNIASYTPNNFYRELEQAFINEQWENTTSLLTIQEQNITKLYEDYYQDFEFSNIEVWVDTVVGQTSTGEKTGYDFLKLIFQNINHEKLEGRYYIINNQYYLSYFDNRVVDVDANLSVRRCNQWMKIVDPMNGSIYQIPVIVDYDMTASSNRISNAIITPNNHATVKVQQNAMTDRLFTTNSRFILGGRAFKITGMQNATSQFINNSLTSLMDIDLFLDELWEQDDIVNSVAFNGNYEYKINFISPDMNLIQGSTGQLKTNVFLNNEPIIRPLIWQSSNENIVQITDNGEYVVVGNEGEFTTITVSLYGNNDVFDTLKISIVNESEIYGEIVMTPNINVIHELETIDVLINVLYNGNIITPSNVTLTIDSEDNQYISYVQNNNLFTLKCLKRGISFVVLNFEATIENSTQIFYKTITLNVSSLLG